ncbi:MAG: excinuclease ABC subunit UvrA, partial [Firmicutes bacterium]|nr:excinuclease ABC subunit UvrA [Bacillota bacterium]
LLTAVCRQFDIPVDQPWRTLTADQQAIVLGGAPEDTPYEFETAFGRHRRQFIRYQGVIPILERRYRETDSESQKAEIQEYMREVPCPSCEGRRLKPAVLAVLVGGLSISALTDLSIVEAR